MTIPCKSPPDPPVETEEEDDDESGEEEEEDSPSDEDSESESEPESAPASKAQPTAAAVSSSEDEESGSDTEPENPVEKPDPNVKSIASGTIDDLLETTNTAKPASSPGAKQTAMREDGDEKKEAKKSKGKSENPEKKGNSTDESKRLFKRMWSKEDEIAVLKGMVDYLAEKKADPVADLSAFRQFIKKSLHIDVSETKLRDKIRRLKKKYENDADKAKNGNDKRIFTKPHEQKAYDLSKKIWGNEKRTGKEEAVESPNVTGMVVNKRWSRGAVEMTKKDDKMVERVEKLNDLVSEKNVVYRLKNVSSSCDCLEIEGLKNWQEFIKDEKMRAELMEMGRELKQEEIELITRKWDLLTEHTEMILDGLKRSRH